MTSNTKTKAEIEFDVLQKDAVVHEFREEILALVDKFGNSDQSGASAPLYAQIISSVVEKLCMQQPIGPITGDDSEWICDHFQVGKCQNKRLSSVFKDKFTSNAYYLDAIIFRGEDEYDSFSGCVQDVSSSQPIMFPFQPKTFYVDVRREVYDQALHGGDAERVTCDDNKDYVYFIKDMNQVKAAQKYCLNSVKDDG